MARDRRAGETESAVEEFGDHEAWREAFGAIGALGFSGILSLLALGVWIAWVWFALNCDVPLYGSGTYDAVAPAVALVSFGLMVCACAVVPATREWLCTSRGVAISVFAAVLGCALLWLESLGVVPDGTSFVSVALCGCSAGALLFLCGLSFSRLDAGPSMVAYSGVALCAFLSYFCLTGLGETAGYVLFALAPMGVAALLLPDLPALAQRARFESGAHERRTSENVVEMSGTSGDGSPARARLERVPGFSVGLRRLIVAAAVYFGSVSFTHAMAPIEEHGFASDAGIVLTTVICVAVLLIYVTRRGTFRILKTCYVASVLAIIFANTVAPFTGDTNLALEALRNASYLVLFMAIWLLLTWAASYGEAVPAHVYGIAFAATGLAMAIAWVAGIYIHLRFGEARDAFTIGVGFVVLAFFSFGFNVRDVPKLVREGEHSRRRDGAEDDRRRGSADGGVAPGTSGSAPVHAMDDMRPDALPLMGDAQLDGRPPMGDARPDGGSSMGDAQPDALRLIGDARGVPVPSEASDPLFDRIARLATEHDLSPREVDVLGYLAQGYGGDRIADELVISYHTVRAHVRSIYRKLDIHSREELVDRLRG